MKPLTLHNMKHVKVIVAVLLLIPFIVSCQKVHRFRIAFDADEVHFEKEGGSRTLHIVEGTFEQMHVPVISGSDYPPFEGDGTNYLKRDWIELRRIVEDETVSLEITVQENAIGKARNAQVTVAHMEGESMTTVKVYQE